MSQLVTLNYNEIPVIFQSDDAYINATLIAKEFNKQPADYLKQKRTIEYIYGVKRNRLTEQNQLVRIIQGGSPDEQGTWLHPKLAIDFARWLNVDFAIWCDIEIEKLLQSKQSAPLPVSYIAALEALIVSEKAKEAVLLELNTVKIELDVSHEWSSLKRFAAWNHVVWNSLSWKKVKDASFKVGKPPYKIFDANFPEGVNNYHIDAWKLAYPDYEFPEVLEH
jgi:hypothetical protein